MSHAEHVPPATPAVDEPRWIDLRGGQHCGIALWIGARPLAIVADARGADVAAWLARWHDAPLLVDARCGVRGPTRALRAARRVIAGATEHEALRAAGVEAGRLLEIDPTVTPCDPARGPVTCVPTLHHAVLEADRLARGRGVAPRPRGAYAVLKRALDIAVGVTLLVLLAPLLALVALAIRIDSPGPALFRQRRVGRGSSEFTILKFRTMATGTPDLASHLVGPGSSRVTRLGRVLRRTSIDELPQLWHLVTGDMTLVGPRPALHNQYDLVALRQAAGIDALKPGVTGWAQVNGRDDIPLERKVAYDREYLERMSPRTDAAIVLRTAIVLFSDRGTY